MKRTLKDLLLAASLQRAATHTTPSSPWRLSFENHNICRFESE